VLISIRNAINKGIVKVQDLHREAIATTGGHAVNNGSNRKLVGILATKV
jgi:hypothetical protein